MIIKTDNDIISSYRRDASNYEGIVSKVFFPETQHELKVLVKDLFLSRTPFTMSGACTGLSGACVPQNGIVISTNNLNRIIDIDYNNQTATVEPGVLLSELNDILNQNGFFFPPNPTETNSSIGGNIILNSSGSRSFKYGAYRNFIQKLNIILPDGDELNLNVNDSESSSDAIEFKSITSKSFKVPFYYQTDIKIKNNVPYYLRKGMKPMDLFIGSEGTLGIVSEAVLKFHRQPDENIGFMVFFDNVDNMLNYVEKVRNLSNSHNKTDVINNGDIAARLIELFDMNSLNILRSKYTQVPENAIGCIWTEQECSQEYTDEIIANWHKLIKSSGADIDNVWISLNDELNRRYSEIRHSLPTTINEIVTRNGYRKIGTDTAVPAEHFNKFYQFVDNLLKSSKLEYAVWGHVGDSHLHANILPKSDEENVLALRFYEIILRKSYELGGTISAEHGIGKIKKKYLSDIYGTDYINQLKAVKMIFDPYNLLGRGNLFD